MNDKIKRLKPYKATDPVNTVNKIRDVLNSLGLHLIETTVKCDTPFHSTILSIKNPENDQIIFSTYGKGSSDEWASASAWGEMIERIQNIAFYMILIYPACPENDDCEIDEFKYFPDERIFTLGAQSDFKFEENFKNLTKNKDDEIVNDKKIIGVPFFSVFDNTIEYLPFRALQVIVGSNGMCSGNTRDEALIQGISEIFERHVLKSFYLHPYTPPDIPLEYFDDTEISNTIFTLQKQFGYSIQIKDCSMGKGYPVIGVLIKNKDNYYAFHLGADPSPITALERCFTEMYQGGNICFQSITELYENSPYDIHADFWKKNLSMTIKSYAGQWPNSILYDESSYEFLGFEHPESISDHIDLQYLLMILKRDERRIYIRDNSFLGIPSYYIYIPGMSEISNFPDNKFSTCYLNFDKFIPVITKLKNSGCKDRQEMMRNLSEYIYFSPSKQFNANEYLRFFQNHFVAQLMSDKFLNLIDFSLLGGRICDHYTDKEIKSNPFLDLIYKCDMTFKPSEIFNYLNLPNCFHCDTCNYSDCNLPFIKLIWKRMKERMKLTLRDQSNIFNQ